MEGHGAQSGLDLIQVLALLAAAVIAVPLFRRLGLGSVLGYLAAGLVIGPFGIAIFHESEAILHVAELGVVMFLFVIGLEMRPTRLWALRRSIFGLGVLQVALCSALLTAVGVLTGFPVAASFVAGAGFVLTSTAVVMQVLEERQQLNSESGQRVVSILLLEDLAIVPLLAAVAFLAPIAQQDAARGLDWGAIAIGVAAVVGLILAGRYLLNPMFRVLSRSGAREVMTAAALLVVLGAAVGLQMGGLSMAMGAFLAGVMLSESSFRHQLEADIEPFRGILLGLFFLAVGMSLDLGVVARSWQLVAGYVAAYMIVKALAIYGVARVLKTSHSEALERAVLMAQGGEFAFVLYGAALGVGIITPEQSSILTAIIVVSMALTPLALIVLRLFKPKPQALADGVDTPEDLSGEVLVIGFGRVGQVASQLLLARGHTISIIDTDVEMIQAAADYDFKVYYGDGCRLDILHAAGAGRAKAVLVCTDNQAATNRAVELMKSEFPLTPVLARAFDREHALKLVKMNVDFQMRETFESALMLGAKTLETLGQSEQEIADTIEEIRRRDEQRFEAELTGGFEEARSFFRGNATNQKLDLPKVEENAAAK